MVDRVMFSSNSNEWETPQNLFDLLDIHFRFTLDPCCTKETAKCKRYYTIEDDGLSKSWSGETVFMNPPYGKDIEKWMEKAYEEACYAACVVCLVPVRSDTKWWHDYVMYSNYIIFLEGRLKFNKWAVKDGEYVKEEKTTSAPFPSAIVVFMPNLGKKTFERYSPPIIGRLRKVSWTNPDTYWYDKYNWWDEMHSHMESEYILNNFKLLKV